jgi:hypothetical protein
MPKPIATAHYLSGAASHQHQHQQARPRGTAVTTEQQTRRPLQAGCCNYRAANKAPTTSRLCRGMGTKGLLVRGYVHVHGRSATGFSPPVQNRPPTGILWSPVLQSGTWRWMDWRMDWWMYWWMDCQRQGSKCRRTKHPRSVTERTCS